MSKYTRKSNRVSEQTQEEALDLANNVLKPSEIKEHRKIVAQGIQKGIDLYKKQQKAKARELDKRLKKVSQSGAEETEIIIEKVQLKQHWLPWVLLLLSWFAFAAIYFKGHM